MSAVNSGTECKFGIDDVQFSELFVQSYSVNASFNLSGLVADEAGLTKTARYDDRKTELTVDGVCITSGMPTLGAALNFTLNVDTGYSEPGTASINFAGNITAISQKGSNKDFTSVSITAVSYEGVPNAAEEAP